MWKPHNIFSLSVNILLLVLPLWVYNESENEGVIMIIIVMYKVHLSTQQKIYKEIWRETITYAIDVLNGRLFLAKRFTRSNYFQSENRDEDDAVFHIFHPQVTTDNELCRVHGNTWKCDIELDRERKGRR